MKANFEEECKIALNLHSYINKREFFNQDLSSLNRIMEKYFNIIDRDPKEEKQIINFLFKLLDIIGKDASILFSHIDKSSEYFNIIKRLHNDYQDKFDFSVVNPSLFQSSFYLIKINEKMKRFLIIFSIIFPFLFISSFFYYSQRKKLSNELVIYQKSYNELNSIKLQLNDYIIQLKNEKKQKKQIQKNLSLLKIQYDANIHSIQLCEQMISVKENMENEMSIFKKQVQTEVLSIKEKQLENELNIIKQNLEIEIQKNKKLQDELSTKNKELEIEIQKNKQLEDQLSAINQNLGEKKQKNKLQKDELTEKNHEIEIQKNKQYEEKLSSPNSNLDKSIKKRMELNDELPRKNESEIKKDKILTDKTSIINQNITNNSIIFTTQKVNSTNVFNQKMQQKLNSRIIILITFIICFSTISFIYCYKTYNENLIYTILAFSADQFLLLFIFFENTTLVYLIKFILFTSTLIYIMSVTFKYGPSISTFYLFVEIICKCYFIISDKFDDYVRMNYVFLFAIEIWLVYYIYNESYDDLIALLLIFITVFFTEINFDISTVLLPNVVFILVIIFSLFGFSNKKEKIIFCIYTSIKYGICNLQLNNIYYHTIIIFAIAFEIFCLLLYWQKNNNNVILATSELFLSLFCINTYWYVLIILSLSVLILIIYNIISNSWILAFLSFLKYIWLIIYIWQKYH